MTDPDRVRRLVASLQHWHGVLAAGPSDDYRRRYADDRVANAVERGLADLDAFVRVVTELAAVGTLGDDSASPMGGDT